MRLSILMLVFLLAAGNAFTLVRAQIRHMVDVASGDSVHYFLNHQGDVYAQSDSGLQKLELPDRMIQIRCQKDVLFMVREDGTVWSFSTRNGLKLLDNDLPSRQVLPMGEKLFMLKNIGCLTVLEKNQVRMLLTGHRYKVMADSGTNNIYLLDEWGRLYRYDTYVEFLELIDPSPDSVAMAASGTDLFVLKKSGRIYKRQDNEFLPLMFKPRALSIETNGNHLFFIDENQALWELNLAVDRLKEIPLSIKPDRIRWVQDRLYITSEAGNVTEYKPVKNYFQIQNNFHRLWQREFYPARRGFKVSGE